MKRIDFTLHNADGKPVKCHIVVGFNTAYIGIDGYSSMDDSDNDGLCAAIDTWHHDLKDDDYLEYAYDELRGNAYIGVWDDINREELKTITLRKARIECRDE